MLSGILFLDNKGDILIDKSQGSGISKADIEILRGSLQGNKKISPMIEFYNNLFLAQRVNDVLVIGICKAGSDTAFVAELMVQLVSFCEEYLHEPLTEAKIKTDFVSVYKTIDQFMIDGYPLLADLTSLSSILPIPPVSKARWAFKDRQYVNVLCTEIYDAFFDSSGHISLLQIRGSVSVDAKLDPKQLCTIEFTPPMQGFEATYNEKISVEMGQPVKVTFSPPISTQPIIIYTLQSPRSASPPVFVKPTFLWQKTGIRIEIEAKIGPNQPSSCFVSFEVPSQCCNPSLAVSIGTVVYKKEVRTVLWELPCQAQDARLSGWIPYDFDKTSKNSVKDQEEINFTEITTNVKFRIFGPLKSGFAIKDVSCSVGDDLITKSMKYQTINGRFEFAPLRM